MDFNKYLDIAPEVAEALAAGKPVVALESTIISHGMPYPQNVETALNVEKILRDAGVVPATIAIIGGRLKAGLSAEEIDYLGRTGAGVTKAFDAEKGLAGFVESECGKDFGAEFASLKADAALGREYRAALKEEVKRLALLCGKEFYSALEADFDSMSAQTLKGLKSAFETRAAEKLPLRSQLPTAGETVRFEGDAYLV